MASKKPKATSMTVIELTDPGSRDHNEDQGLAVSGRSQHLLVVCDGMGGHAAGEVASGLAVETFAQLFTDDYDDSGVPAGEFLSEAINSANQAIRLDAKENPSREGMGSTCVVALARGNKLSVGHVGDSRGYLIRGGGIRQLTRDHSFVEEMVKAGMITPHETHTNPQRNVILQSLGCSDTINIDVNENTVSLKVGDYILLCSDGLTAVVADQEIAETVERLDDPEAIAKDLVNLTNRRGGPDNVTVVIGRYDGDLIEGPPVHVMCENENAIDLYRLILHREGYRIVVHDCKASSLDYQKEDPAKLIIVENDDPKITLGVVQDLRKDKNFTKLPIIAVTDGRIAAPKARAAGATALLHSKALLAELLPKIHEILDSDSPKVYIIEEAPGVSESISKSLSQASLTVKTFNTEQSLQDAIKRAAPALLIVHMNNSPGLERLCRRLKTMASTQHSPIVLTAEGAVSNPREAYLLGADYYLPNVSDLLNLTEMLLARKS